VLAVAACVLLLVAAGGALAWLPSRGEAPVEQATYSLAPPEPEVDATYTFSFTPSPDLPPDPGVPQGSAVGPTEPLRLVATGGGRFEVDPAGPDVIVPPTDVPDLTGGQAPFRLEPPTDPVAVGGTWEHQAAPLHAGGEDLDGTCTATLRDLTDEGAAVVDVACTWPSPAAGAAPVASSEETWLVGTDGRVLSWRQLLTPAGSEHPSETRLVKVSDGSGS
jgi:hypothetical protein